MNVEAEPEAEFLPVICRGKGLQASDVWECGSYQSMQVRIILMRGSRRSTSEALIQGDRWNTFSKQDNTMEGEDFPEPFPVHFPY